MYLAILTPDTLDLIRNARRRVEPPERWTTGDFARDENGLGICQEALRDVPANECSCWCALGALITEHRIAWNCGRTPNLYDATQALARAARQIHPDINPNMSPDEIVTEFNDRDYDPRTHRLERREQHHARVLAMFDRALANAA